MSETPDLPPHVLEALAKMDKSEADIMVRVFKAVAHLRYSGKLVIYIVGGAFAALILVSQAIDAAKKLFPVLPK